MTAASGGGSARAIAVAGFAGTEVCGELSLVSGGEAKRGRDHLSVCGVGPYRARTCGMRVSEIHIHTCIFIHVCVFVCVRVRVYNTKYIHNIDICI